MQIEVTELELLERINKLCRSITEKHPDWDTAIILSRVSQFYFTGTMQDGLLLVKRNGSAFYFARRSFERAVEESPLSCIYPMESYKDAAAVAGSELGKVLVETEMLTVGTLERLKKYFAFKEMLSLDNIIFEVRAVKSPFELHWMKESGKQHKKLLEEIAPSILREGMSELDFTAELYEQMLKNGFHGVSRFYRHQTEMIAGQIGFGENSLYPTNFDGPGGMRGMSAAVPILGSRESCLKKGDLVFVDIGFGMNGYHSDRTQVYMFGGTPSAGVVKAHRKCIEVQRHTAGLLKPGNKPSQIYETVMSSLDSDFLHNFMGFGNRKVKFLGHGIGLHIDELPAIANGFDSPLEENMVIALEPKKGIAGIGMVGVEDTYIVTPEGGQLITGGEKDIIVV
ncbi:putative peptidase [Ruminiclostridium hungatei]|uniref:Putative peptidase n=1 Tax=Ruminiclostridium hungatei TaxID=48256 RepID=A0A1V4SJY8_RUMHU|nr:Xaa-Pro peptidase family protein [Ruminiclostridium hungatei]OPX44198.1 putative peptidase [Ruminiclostridium hungatei]